MYLKKKINEQKHLQRQESLTLEDYSCPNNFTLWKHSLTQHIQSTIGAVNVFLSERVPVVNSALRWRGGQEEGSLQHMTVST